MYQTIKTFLMTYTDPKPKYDGISADELTKLLCLALEGHLEADIRENNN